MARLAFTKHDYVLLSLPEIEEKFGEEAANTLVLTLNDDTNDLQSLIGLAGILEQDGETELAQEFRDIEQESGVEMASFSDDEE